MCPVALCPVHTVWTAGPVPDLTVTSLIQPDQEKGPSVLDIRELYHFSGAEAVGKAPWDPNSIANKKKPC